LKGSGSEQRFGAAFRGIAGFKIIRHRVITASNDKANPARRADQAIVAEVCRAENDCDDTGNCQVSRTLAHRRDVLSPYVNSPEK
jgi:hypothetical protein